MVEVLRELEPEWASALYWEFFEQNMHYRGALAATEYSRYLLQN